MIKVSTEKNQPIPKAILEKPILPLYLIYIMESFTVLSSCRQLGMGLSPISLTEIKSYMEIYGVLFKACEFIEYIKYLDFIYLKIMEDKNGNSNTNSNPNIK